MYARIDWILCRANTTAARTAAARKNVELGRPIIDVGGSVPFDVTNEIPRFGKRAELLVAWYLRFNGFFPLTDFILHDAGSVLTSLTRRPGLN